VCGLPRLIRCPTTNTAGFVALNSHVYMSVLSSIRNQSHREPGANDLMRCCRLIPGSHHPDDLVGLCRWKELERERGKKALQ
jgi:hypothetical protein